VSEFNVSESMKAQEKLCKEKGYPHFAPSSGVCWKCHKNIYEPVEQKRTLFWQPDKPEETFITGITVEEASNKLVTGCPHCHRSYCD
jgi:hypothetical protein